MRAVHRDQIVGSLLLLFAAAWTGIVYQTVHSGFGDGIGPRAFPLGLGILLLFLSALLLASGMRKSRNIVPVTQVADDSSDEPLVQTNAKVAVIVLCAIMVYGFLMEKIGFVLATILCVFGMLWLILGVRRPALLAGMSLGMAFGCWAIFGKLLGAYLPPGTWISPF